MRDLHVISIGLGINWGFWLTIHIRIWREICSCIWGLAAESGAGCLSSFHTRVISGKVQRVLENVFLHWPFVPEKKIMCWLTQRAQRNKLSIYKIFLHWPAQQAQRNKSMQKVLVWKGLWSHSDKYKYHSVPKHANTQVQTGGCTQYPTNAAVADPGGTGGQGPLAPKISSKSCSFQAILRENSYFEHILGSGPSPGVQTPLGPPDQNPGSETGDILQVLLCRVRKGTESQSVVVCVAKYPGGKSWQRLL